MAEIAALDAPYAFVDDLQMPNFRRFALYYLNDWLGSDSRFVSGLSASNPQADRRQCLSEAVNYYGVARTLPKIDESERLGAALVALDAVSGPIAEEAVVSTVCDLAKSLQNAYGQYAISAASKLLWIRFRSPIIIYDAQALICLNRTSPKRLYRGYYRPYREEWLRQFTAYSEPIRSACMELPRVKDFSRAQSMSDDELTALVSNRWFHERIFDKYLWSGGPE